jgi:hypothetical protein
MIEEAALKPSRRVYWDPATSTSTDAVVEPSEAVETTKMTVASSSTLFNFGLTIQSLFCGEFSEFDPCAAQTCFGASKSTTSTVGGSCLSVSW